MKGLRFSIRARRPPAPALAGAIVCALAAWVSASLLAVTGDAVSTRVALLAPWWVPAIAFASVALLAAVTPVQPRAWWPTLIPGLLLLPWLPFPVPAAFLLLVGPLGAWVWAATGVALLGALWPSEWRRGWTRALTSSRRAGLAALGISAVVYCSAAWMTASIRPAGDEPHYLVIAQSLVKDGDLQIENNHQREDYAEYYSGVLEPDYLVRGTNGRIYSIHAPGLPALVAPAYAVAGYPGVVVFLALVSALGAWLAWRTAYLLTGRAGAAWFGWGAVALSTPFFFHSAAVFPDGAGAVLTMTGVAALVALDVHGREPGAESRTPTRWLLHGAALAVLPWLHTRYAAIAVILGACLAWRLVGHRRYREVAAFCCVPLVSAVAWFASFHVLYGTFNPAAPYGSYTQSSIGNVSRALPALLLDQQFGLVPNAPVYAIALGALALMARSRLRLAIELSLVIFVYLVAVATYNMWWGGWSAPARFAVPVLLAFSVPAADFWNRRGPAGRASALTALVVSLLITAGLLVAENGRTIFNSRDGFARWLDWVSPLVDAPRALPSFLRVPRGVEWTQAGIWLAVLLLACAALRLVTAGVADPARRRARLSVAAPFLFASAVMVAATLGWKVARAEAITPTTAQLRLLQGYDGSLGTTGLQYRPFRTTTAAAILPRLRLSTSGRRLPGPPGPLTIASLPAGVYRLRPAGTIARYAALEARIGRSARPIERWAFDGSLPPADCVIRVPIGVTVLSVTGESRAGGRTEPLQLQPVSIGHEPPAAGAAPSGLDALANRAARYGDVLVFAFDPQVYLEQPGFWLTGDRTDRIVLAPDTPGGTVAMLLRNGPNANRVTFRSRDWAATVSLGASEERVLEIPLDRASGAVQLEVHAEKGFRPSDLDPTNGDQRYLGVWLEPAK